jgi:hypothetical protein
MVPLMPGIRPSLHLDTAVTLPVGVECYAAYALRAWLAADHAISGRTRRFARRPAVFSFTLGMAGQVAFHPMDQDQITTAPWAITTLVSCLPVLVLGMGTAVAHMLREDTAAAKPRTGPTHPDQPLACNRRTAPQSNQGTSQTRIRRTGPPPRPARRALPRHRPGMTAMPGLNSCGPFLTLQSRLPTMPATSPAALPGQASASLAGSA